ncbi:MAG: hypothetical protein KGL02_10920 [Acidobacteriota bacterium]|nr:hypothetical protein [Acidobacteriota bacterium]
MAKPLILAIALVAGAALAITGARAQDAAQPANQSQAQSPAPQKPKVWTDDNIDSVRTPSDDYQIQQQQEQAQKQQAQQAAAQQAAAQAAQAAGPAPKTVKQADSMIAAKKQALVDQQQYLQSLQKDLNNPNNSDLDRTRLDWRMKSHTASEQQTQGQLKQLEEQRAALAKKEATDKGSAGGSGNSSSTDVASSAQ